MDMYQKRKIRQEKKNSESNQESLHNVPINWLMEKQEKIISKSYK